jgi:hypothetical protein
MCQISTIILCTNLKHTSASPNQFDLQQSDDRFKSNRSFSEVFIHYGNRNALFRQRILTHVMKLQEPSCFHGPSRCYEVHKNDSYRLV